MCRWTPPGITRTARADSLGVRGLGCMDLEFDVEVSDDQVLGAVDQGFRLAMWALQGGRVGVAAQALGIGEAAIAEAIAFAKTRHTFGQSDLPATKRFSGCSPMWRPNSKRRGC